MSEIFRPDVVIHEGTYSRFALRDGEGKGLDEDISHSLGEALEKARSYLACKYPALVFQYNIGLELRNETFAKVVTRLSQPFLRP